MKNTQEFEEIVPLPDLSTKPEDIVGYCFGFSCTDGHIGKIFDLITMDKYAEQMVCQTCGQISTIAIVKRTAEAQFLDLTLSNEIDCMRNGIKYKPHYGWVQHYYMSDYIVWTRKEFVKFLNDCDTKGAIQQEEERK
jgi:hypothetical protein